MGKGHAVEPAISSTFSRRNGPQSKREFFLWTPHRKSMKKRVKIVYPAVPPSFEGYSEKV
jgi:hypothetical protein